jgi:hypothetical protein
VLVRLDVTSNDTATAGLSANESITASVTGVPTSVTAKTLVANGGAITDTTAWSGGNRPDLVMVETKGQVASNAPGATTSTTNYTDWTKVAPYPAAGATTTLYDSATPTSGSTDGVIGSLNNGFVNMDGRVALATTNYTKSYYVTILGRSGAAVVDQGVYTITFTLTDKDGNVRSTQTLKVDFVSSKAKSDAKLSFATSGTFFTNTALAIDPSATNAAYATLSLTNRDGGAIRSTAGVVESPTVSIQDLAKTPVADTMTLTISDFGATDFGDPTTAKNRVPQNGVYGISGTTPATVSSATQTYQFYALYGNATPATAPLTLVSATSTANAAHTKVLATAAGLSAADQEVIALSSSKEYKLPTTTTTVTLKFTIQSAANTPAGGVAITAKPTWNAINGSSQVTPATSTTGTVYTTDALGNFSMTVTNSTPIDTANVSIVLSGAAAFGTSTNTVTLTWAKAAAATITVIDPVADVTVLTGSTNVTTVVVKDQFGNPVSGQLLSVGVTTTPASTVTPAPVIAPITTGADGTATYSYTGAATTTKAVISFNTIPTNVTAVTHTYNYLATLPVVATLTGYFNRTWGSTPATLVPPTGIYNESGTAFVIEDARNISKSLLTATDANTTNDEISLLFTGLTAAGVSATGAAVTVTAGAGGHIVDPSTGLPVKTRTFAVTSSGTAAIRVLATGTGAISFTATSGAATATAAMWVAKRKQADNGETAGRFVTVTSAKTGTANGTGVPVTVAVTDRYGNPVSGVAVNVVASGVGSFMGGNITQSYTTDAAGTYTFLANTSVSEGGVAKFTATTGTVGSFDSAAGYVGTTEVDSTLAAGNDSASAEITFAAGASAADIAQAAADAAAEAIDAGNNAYDAANAAGEAADAATAAAEQAGEDAVAAAQAAGEEAVAAAQAAGEAAVAAAEAATEAAAEATDAANAATDAANASAEAADAATAAAQDAADAVAALSTQVSEMITALKKQITALTNLVIKIQKKVKA